MKEQRTERGESQVQLAAALEVSGSFLSRVESGEKTLTAEVLDRLAALQIAEAKVQEVAPESSVAKEQCSPSQRAAHYCVLHAFLGYQGALSRLSNGCRRLAPAAKAAPAAGEESSSEESSSMSVQLQDATTPAGVPFPTCNPSDQTHMP